ncbi:hypothetical protein LUZ61_019730 [Rhynchospora tenuis]|uniref:Uncharacterized protein n=1 Tax=Rhynchospora tenuis TaxID=198213 RepID=A0AAD5ZBN0_9POAL|nr:hypothetical protein LUZ61_019730 [Rhynchospora tenuis]
MSADKRKKKLTDGGGGGAGDDAAVEELLRAAQDDVLLNLRVNSHSVASDSHFSSLDSDLMLRFDALRSKPSVPNPSASNSDGDDLEARFAKLKGGVGSDGGVGSVGNGEGVGEESGMEDEVEKVMKWAMDSVRLDMSSGKSTGEEDVSETVTSESESQSSDEEDEGDEKAMGKKKVNAKAEKKKWFFQR